jgi:hypothetical protein
MMVRSAAQYDPDPREIVKIPLAYTRPQDRLSMDQKEPMYE